MRRTIINLGCLAAALILMAPAAMSQTGGLRGTVVGEDGKPLEGAVIQIRQLAMDQTREAKSGRNGSFIHAGLPTGMYEVSCVVAGVVKQTLSSVRIAYGENTNISFDLRQAKQEADALRALATTGELTEEQLQGLSPEQRRAVEEEMEARAEELAGKRELNDAFNNAMQAKKAEQWDVAIESFQKAMELSPENAVIMGNFADTYMQKAQASQGAEREAALTESFAIYEKMLVLNPTDGTTLNNYALALYLAGRQDEGRATLEKAIELNPGEAGMYYYNLGASILQADMSNQEGACANFLRATESGSYAPAFFQHGNCLMNQMTMDEQGNIVPAPGTKEAFQKYLELDPNGPHAADAQQALQILEMSVQTELGGGN